ncbi:cupin superfamily subfamily [Micractinium conductrix]|uniref:Cupin superfamily subfamily n=1 Tax=Micractinium conductrix TaxID=554055 RepID=A0A2P6VS67_9CHLO|nr:cupin superfamily subfamily [Micractinium conductrix]|eukprot:PSC76917.1 cupin superfamily subfamily [Micractinium conductrix]
MRAPDKKPRCTGPTSGGGKSGGGGKAGAATGSSAKSELAAALKWLNSYPRVSRWMAQYDIEALVDAGGGIVRIDNFLPEQVARGALAILRRLPPGRWRPTEAAEDYTHNNISHAFWSVKGGIGGADGGGSNDAALKALLRAFTLLRPEQLNAFSAARYDRGHHIAPHDDRAYTPVKLDTGEVITCSRDLTCVYYLTSDWQEEWGGALVDLEAPPEEGEEAAEAGGSDAALQRRAARRHSRGQGRLYVPRWNSAVFFRVPRYHAVTPLTTDRPRYSVFGWFLQPGRLYELYTGEGEQDGEQQQQDEEQQKEKTSDRRTDGQAQQGRLQQGDAAAAAPTAEQQQQRPGGKRRHKKQRRQKAAEGAPQCLLAQRLLARLAAGGGAEGGGEG